MNNRFQSIVQTLLFLAGLSILAMPATSQTSIQDNASDTGPNSGILPGGAYGISNIESMNVTTGNLSLNIPVAHLPPGPGGFTAGVNLVYNSTLFDTQSGPYVCPPAICGSWQIGHEGVLGIASYLPSTHGGGWSYSYEYALWSQPAAYIPAGDGCPSGVTTNYEWFKTFLATPGGANHVLRLVASITESGSAGPSFTNSGSDANLSNYGVDFSGNPNNYWCVTGQSNFQGTLVYTTIDSTYIRVEANTVTKLWVAYFPDGTQVSGPIITEGTNGSATMSDATEITDRNGNTLTMTGTCMVGTACTETLEDAQQREMVIGYSSSSSGSWADTISWPGGPSQTLTTTVNWETYQFSSGLPYSCNAVWVISATNCVFPSSTTSAPVVSSIQLPPDTNSTSDIYEFAYNVSTAAINWGELHTIKMCTGTLSNCGAQYQIGYTYYYDSASSRPFGAVTNPLASRTLSYTENRDGTLANLTETTGFSVPLGGSGGTTTLSNPDGSQTVYYSSNLCSVNITDFCAPLVYKITGPDQTITEMAWITNTIPPTTPTGGFVNPYVAYLAQTIGSEAKGRSATEDSNGNTTSAGEYNWFAASGLTRSNGVLTAIPGTPTRTTASTYYASSLYYWNHGTSGYLRAPQTVTVGSATTNYSYDNALTTANLVQQSQWDSVTSAYINTSWTYLSNGNVTTATDPNGIVTRAAYDAPLYLYPVEVDLAYQRPEQQTITPGYDNGSGLLLTSKDANSVTTTYTYDNLGRQIEVAQTGNGSLSRSTSTCYDDAGPSSSCGDTGGFSVTTTQNQTGLITRTYYDPLGRVRLTVDEAGNKVQDAYRFGTSGAGYQLESTPYASSGSPTAWRLTTRNSAADSTLVQTYMGSNAPTPWVTGSNATLTGSASTTNYAASLATCSVAATSVIDEASNTSYYCPDGLGRLTGVTDAAGSLTQYAYDLLNDLTTVTQGTQTRTFTYSTLGRLTNASNPESGSETYTYDKNGNLLTRTDARSITTTYAGYDGLNRPQTKAYSDGTPTVTYTYDQDWKGALSSVSIGSGTATYSTAYTHDGFGRIATSAQTIEAAPAYNFAYSYSPVDQLTQVQYPSGRKVDYGLDSAGRVNAVQNVATAQFPQQHYYASSITYTPASDVSSLSMGNGVTEQFSWNDRLQLTGITAGSLLSLSFYPCSGQAVSCSSGNTGSVQGQTIAAPGLTLTQSYTYDPLHRLATAQESGTWSQTWNYTNGNAYLNTYSGYTPQPFTPTVSSNFNSQNQLQIQSSSYDAAGNQKQIGGVGTSFDAEGRMLSVSLNGATINYVYDGEGQRVVKQTVSGGTVTDTVLYVYDATGNLAAEYETSADGAVASPCGTGTCYLSQDQLGSTRLVMDSNGNAQRRYDYYPFGDEIAAGTGGRSTAMGYQASADGFNPKFSGMERDVYPSGTPTGLDYFNARYYSPDQGRFASPDPENAGADLSDPRTWNGYAYVNNDPLSYTDPSGMIGEATAIGAATGNPAGIAIGAAIDAAEILGALFGFGGGSSRDWYYTARALGALQTVPGLSIGGDTTLNTGTVFSSGNTGPFVFSMSPSATWPGIWAGADWGELLGRAAGGVLGGVMIGLAASGHALPRGATMTLQGHLIYAKKVSKTSGKERATDVPDYARYHAPKGPNETCAEFAARVVLAQFGVADPRAHQRGPGSDYSKIRKACERGGL